MAQFMGVPGPSQDEFNALSGQVSTLNSKITNVVDGTITKQTSLITDADFKLNFCKKVGRLLMVSGYIRVITSIPANTTIASVSILPLAPIYQSVVSSEGNTGRFLLNANGDIKNEKVLDTDSAYYSITFVGITSE